jgi:hypothetical protein
VTGRVSTLRKRIGKMMRATGKVLMKKNLNKIQNQTNHGVILNQTILILMMIMLAPRLMKKIQIRRTHVSTAQSLQKKWWSNRWLKRRFQNRSRSLSPKVTWKIGLSSSTPYANPIVHKARSWEYQKALTALRSN